MTELKATNWRRWTDAEGNTWVSDGKCKHYRQKWLDEREAHHRTHEAQPGIKDKLERLEAAQKRDLPKRWNLAGSDEVAVSHWVEDERGQWMKADEVAAWVAAHITGDNQ